MIFCSKNEKGELAWRLVLDGRKTVTRRLKPLVVGKVVAVQPGRGKKAAGYIRVISCVKHKDWYERMVENAELGAAAIVCRDEACKEGFGSWMSLCSWLIGKNIDIFKTFRIEFMVVKKDG